MVTIKGKGKSPVRTEVITNRETQQVFHLTLE
jgi:hypothetical protein